MLCLKVLLFILFFSYSISLCIKIPFGLVKLKPCNNGIQNLNETIAKTVTSRSDARHYFQHQRNSSFPSIITPFTSTKDKTIHLNHLLLADIIKMSNSVLFPVTNRNNFNILETPMVLTKSIFSTYNVIGKIATVERKFIFKAVPPSYISNVFVLPFDTNVWYCCFGLTGVIFIVIYAITLWEFKDDAFKKNNLFSRRLRPHPVDIVLMEVSCTAQQGFEAEPRSNSGRIAFIWTLIALMFLCHSFAANIVAILQSTSESLNTFEAIVRSRISVGFEKDIPMNYFYQLTNRSANDDNLEKLRHPWFVTLKQGVNILQQEFFAFYANSFDVYEYINLLFSENEKCALREIVLKPAKADYWSLVKKDFPYKELLKVSMTKLSERGILSRESRKLFSTKPYCEGEMGAFASVGFMESYGAFLVMLSGLLLSCILFFIERLVICINSNNLG